MSTPAETFPEAVIRFPAGHDALITFCRNAYNVLLNNPKFPNPDPTLPVFLVDIDSYASAQGKAANGGKGNVKARNAARKKVKNDVHHLRDYVQSVSEQAASPADAAALIESVFSVKRVTPRQKAELTAKNTDVSGRVLLDAKAVAPNATYWFEYSVDSKTWTVVPEGMKSKVLIDGLTPGTKYSFRFRALTRKGPRDYSQVVTLLVQ